MPWPLGFRAGTSAAAPTNKSWHRGWCLPATTVGNALQSEYFLSPDAITRASKMCGSNTGPPGGPVGSLQRASGTRARFTTRNSTSPAWREKERERARARACCGQANHLARALRAAWPQKLPQLWRRLRLPAAATGEHRAAVAAAPARGAAGAALAAPESNRTANARARLTLPAPAGQSCTRAL